MDEDEAFFYQHMGERSTAQIHPTEEVFELRQWIDDQDRPLGFQRTPMEDSWKVSSQGKIIEEKKYLELEDEGEDDPMMEAVRPDPPETTRGHTSRASRVTYCHSDFKARSLSKGEDQRAPLLNSKLLK